MDVNKYSKVKTTLGVINVGIIIPSAANKARIVKNLFSKSSQFLAIGKTPDENYQ